MNEELKSKIKNKNAGFTLIETIVAIFVLCIALNGVITLITSSIFGAQYSKNEITAMYLAQEAIDKVRNDRDTIAFQNYQGGNWDSFLLKYGYDVSNNSSQTKCFTKDGCDFEVSDINANIESCGGSAPIKDGKILCAPIFYDEKASSSYYTLKNTDQETIFRRRITMATTSNYSPDSELDVKVEIEWLNSSQLHTRTLTTSLFNWR